MRYLWVLCWLLFTSGSAWAEFVTRGDCITVIASRPTLAAAHEYRAMHPQYGISAIYLSSNGWFALTGDAVEEDSAGARLGGLKSAGLIPQDSFCSGGKGFVERVWPAPVNPSAPAADGLFLEFDAQPLDVDEKRFLQASLVLTGDYDGRLDGQWGRASQKALEKWSVREFGDFPNNFHVASLAASGGEMLETDDWDVYYDRDLDISLLVPFARVHTGDTSDLALDIEANDDSFSALVAQVGRTSAIGFHGQLIDTASGQYDTSPYIVRKDAFWVTSYSDGVNMIYQRTDFDRRMGGARMALFTANSYEGHHMASLLVASYRIGPQRVLKLPPEGQLMSYMQVALEVLSDADEAAASAPAKKTTSQARFSGSGFYINENADVMTNAHVVENCNRLSVDGAPAEILAIDKRLDLAILKRGSGSSRDGGTLAFAASPARLNSDVTVAGFPLNGLLETLNVTRGSVSALKGMDNDATRLQITAPVQAGNSGGPIVDRYGQVVGVVVSKMNGLTVADMTGDLPQNVNFGVRGSIARIFAEANNIRTRQSEDVEFLPPEVLAERLSEATVLVECY